MSHAALNKLVHLLFMVMEKAESSIDVQYARSFYNFLTNRNTYLPEALQSAASLGAAMAQLSRDDYANRGKMLKGIRLLPVRSAYVRHVKWYTEHSWVLIGSDWEKYKKAILDVKK
jgi:hypothetical protein